MSGRRAATLRVQLAAAFVAMAVAPTLLLGLAAIRLGVGQAREQVTSRNEQVALAVAGEVSRFLDAQLVAMLEISMAAESDSSLAVDLPELLAFHLRANRAIGTILVVERSGFVAHVAPFDPDLRGVDLSGHPAVRDAWARNEPTWSSATISMQTGEPVVTLVVPGRRFTVVAYLDLHALEAIIARKRAGAGGEVAVLDRDGTFIAHREERLVAEQVNVKDLALVRDALAGHPATAEYRFMERDWLGSTATVPLTRWVVLVAEPTAQAYRRVHALRDVLVLALGLVLGGAALAGIAAARRIVRPLEALSTATRRLASGDYRAALPDPEARSFREVDELAASFSAMTAAVRAREEDLARSERNYRTIVGTPVVGVVRTTFVGEIVFANEAFARMVGVERPELLAGRNILSFYVDACDRARILEQVATAGRAVNVEVRLHSAASVEKHVLVNVARDGETLTTVAVDVSDLRRAASDRERLEQQLFHAQKLEAIGRLAGGVAHDFNNLLTAVVGYAGGLREAIPPGRPEREDVEGILEAAKRAGHLTQSLLAYGRKQVLQRRPVDLVDVIHAVEKLLRRVIGEDVELSLSLPQRLTTVADAGQIEQVLLNLCTNARDAMPSGGRLCISGELVDVPAAETERLGLSRAGRHVALRVADTGEGMPPEVVARAFDPFFTTKPAGKGTGLGLAIVDGIVRQHGGGVAVESAPGQGTTVTVLLPAGERPAEASAPAAPIAPHGGVEKILLAEDEPLVRTVLRRALERAGYAVVEAVDGVDAVRKFEEHRDDVALCILDVMMPRKNGRDAAEEIVALRPGVPVLLASGYAADVLAERGLEGAAAELIAKPIAPAELLRKVRDLLDRDRAA
jgi:signal transduction histidine kinase/ActR/RegA family two-component response regulator